MRHLSLKVSRNHPSSCDLAPKNNGCPGGQVCLRPIGAVSFKCFGGHPHGANLEDVAQYMVFYHTLGSTPGTGDIMETLLSSVCIDDDGADNSAPFNGAYQDN